MAPRAAVRCLLVASILLASLCSPGMAIAGQSKTVKGFYEAKKKQTSPEAYRRAERNLAQVRPGMSEMEMLEAMQMEVLALRGKPKDARIDGYLAEASAAANADPVRGRRRMVFGYIEGGRVFEMATIELQDRRVVEVRISAASGDGAGSAAPHAATAAAAVASLVPAELSAASNSAGAAAPEAHD